MARGRRRRKSQSNWPLALGSVALGLLIIALVSGFVWLKVEASNKPVLDKVTYCPTTGPTSVTAVLFDTTDPIIEMTSDDLKNNFDQIGSDIPEGGLFYIAALTPQTGVIETIFEACNPGLDANPWTSNPKLAKQRWEEYFKKPLDQARENIGRGISGDKSPIMAGIQKIKLTVFDPLERVDIPKRLIVASDMIENTPSYNQYKSSLDYVSFDKSQAKREFYTSLKGIDLSILYIKRRNFNHYAEHTAFWNEWASESRAHNLDLDPMEGLN